MRGGIVPAIGLHLAVILAGAITPLVKRAPSTPMVVLPVELMTISDTTNLTPIPDKTRGNGEEVAPKGAAETSNAAAERDCFRRRP